LASRGRKDKIRKEIENDFFDSSIASLGVSLESKAGYMSKLTV
jgi:hypothetical protein